MEEESATLKLHDDFYRDRFSSLVLVICGALIAITAVVCVSLYLYLHVPPPINFKVDADMRVQAAVPLDRPYLSTPDLLQWVADVLPKSFGLDFVYYDSQLNQYKKYFTTQGWQAFKNQLNIFANFTDLQANKIFVYGAPNAAPYILNERVIQETNVYGWWVQVPLVISYDGYKPPPSKNVTFQVLVVRVSTLNNLSGVAIDNIIQAPEMRQG